MTPRRWIGLVAGVGWAVWMVVDREVRLYTAAGLLAIGIMALAMYIFAVIDQNDWWPL